MTIPDKLYKHFQWMGIALYMAALLIVSLSFRTYALKPLWMVWGVGTVLFFFLLTYTTQRRWRHDDNKTFLKKLFWWALGIRMAYVGVMIFYYYWQTGVSFEYEAADSWMYHRIAIYLSKLARQGEIRQMFADLSFNGMGFSDQGYLLHLTTLYTCFGRNILGPRLLKALLSAITCVSIYKLSSRSLGEQTGRCAAIMALFLPQFIHYNATYMKETEMIFLATLALERMDYLIRSQRYTFWNITWPLLLTAMTFGYRTIVGMALIASFMVFFLFGEKNIIKRRTRNLILGITAGFALVMMLTPIGWEMYYIFKFNILTGDLTAYKYQQMGLKYAEYASYKYMAPGFFTLPLTNLVEVANPNQKLMNGTYFVKNYLAFFALWSLVAVIRNKQWRSFSLVGTYTFLYALMIAFSFAFNSERYHLPVMPGLLFMGAYAMTHFRKKDFKFYYIYCAILLVAIVAWNYLKLAGRGLI